MHAPRLLEKLIAWLVLLGFVIFAVGYLYLVVVILRNLDVSYQLWAAIIGFILILLSLIGLRIFGRFFVAEEEDGENRRLP